MEVVVVIIPIPKIYIYIRCTSLANNAAPRGLIRRQGSRRRLEPVVEGRLEIVNNRGDKIRSAHVISVWWVHMLATIYLIISNDKGRRGRTQ